MIISTRSGDIICGKCEECKRPYYIDVADKCKENKIGFEFNSPFECKCGKIHTIIRYSYVDDEGNIICPKCKSNQLSVGNKGFGLGKAAVGGLLLGPVGLLGGFIGSKKTTITCLKCGHKWEVGN